MKNGVERGSGFGFWLGSSVVDRHDWDVRLPAMEEEQPGADVARQPNEVS